MNNLVTMVKDVKAANKEDLMRVLLTTQSLLDTYISLQKQLRAAPLMVKVFLEENDNDISMLDLFLTDLQEMTREVA